MVEQNTNPECFVNELVKNETITVLLTIIKMADISFSHFLHNAVDLCITR